MLRRVGFRACREELEAYASRGYDAAVEDLLHPVRFPQIKDDVFECYSGKEDLGEYTALWFYRMINSERPLAEKMALFSHHLRAIGSGHLQL